MEGDATAQSLRWWQAPLFREEGWRPAAVPYFQACLVFMTLVYAFETYLDLRCVLLPSPGSPCCCSLSLSLSVAGDGTEDTLVVEI